MTGLVCQGVSTAEIGAQPHITVNTVQDHLKSIFDEVEARSRRELVATILREHYLAAAKSGRQLAPNGFFTEHRRSRLERAPPLAGVCRTSARLGSPVSFAIWRGGPRRRGGMASSSGII